MAAQLVGIARRLVADSLIDEHALRLAVDEAKAQENTLVHHLARSKLVEPLAIAAAASDEFRLPLLDLTAFNLDFCPVNIINADLILKHRVLPLSLRDKQLIVAVSDPADLLATNELAFHSGLQIETVIADDSSLSTAIEQYLKRLGRSYTSKPTATQGLVESIEVGTSLSLDTQEELNALDETPLVSFINKLLLEAISLHASDIHFEPYESRYRIRFRIDGLLEEISCPPVKLSTRLASRIKIMAQLNIAEKRVPQDGRIRLRLAGNRMIDVRVNSLPTQWGEKIVMRILDPLNTKLDVHGLGLEPEQEAVFLNTLQRQQGLILVTGPTGSGKSLTLYSALSRLNAASKNISTVEDPVEITLEGINQLAVNSKAGLSFASALRAMLRQDPDIIMLGEIRDLESAEIALRAAQTGHLVLSSLHTLSAAASLSRLRNMGIPLYNLASTVSLIIAQRLARRLCESCKEFVELPEKVMIEQGFKANLHLEPRLFRAVGCSACRDGFQGRIGFYEVVPITEPLSRIIMEDGPEALFSEYMSRQGLLSLREAALLKVAQGLTSLEEANRLT